MISHNQALKEQKLGAASRQPARLKDIALRAGGIGLGFYESLSQLMNSMKIIIPLHFISQKKNAPNDAVTLLYHSQFTPKMKANAVSRLLSSLV